MKRAIAWISCLTILATPGLAWADPPAADARSVCRIEGEIATCPVPWVDWITLQVVELRRDRDLCRVDLGLCQARRSPPPPPPVRIHPAIWIALGAAVGVAVGVLVTR